MKGSCYCSFASLGETSYLHDQGMHVAFAVEVGESEQRVSVNKANLLGQPGKGGLDVDWGKYL